MEYVDLELINSDSEIVIGNITKCFAVWVVLSILTVAACFTISTLMGNLWPNLTLSITITLSISIGLLLFVSLSIGCFHRLRKRSLCWKNSIVYSLVGFIVTTLIAYGLMELFNLLVNKGMN